ncbi:MAG: transposase, partial [Betaproteobacteria bacterium]|nr:transposase [Betaproteobacteria bacterium]
MQLYIYLKYYHARLFARLLRHLKCSVDEELLRRNALQEKKLSPESLAEVALVVRPSTLLRWYRKLIAAKFDGSKARQAPGRPRISKEHERLILEVASGNPRWGAKRIQGALHHIGIFLSHQTIHNVLARNGLPPAAIRDGDSDWAQFMQRHLDLTVATDFFTIESLGLRGLITHYVLYSIDLKTRLIAIGGISTNPNEQWMVQVARNMTMEDNPFFDGKTILLHDRDSKYREAFRQVFKQQGVDPVKLPAFSPDLNAHAERWVESIKSECLRYLIPLGRGFIERAVTQYVLHYNIERARQGLNNSVLTPLKAPFNRDSPVKVSH